MTSINESNLLKEDFVCALETNICRLKVIKTKTVFYKCIFNKSREFRNRKK